MELTALIKQLGPGLSETSLAEFSAVWAPRFVAKGKTLASQGEYTTSEVMLLDGKITSQIADSEGRGACIGFYIGPGIVTPHIARTRENVSLVSLEVREDATIAALNADDLRTMMLRSPEIRDWANGVLRDELSRKTEREWCLAALGGADRLAWFRERYPDHEDLFPHHQIASFLGMTPVTFSRLRARH